MITGSRVNKKYPCNPRPTCDFSVGKHLKKMFIPRWNHFRWTRSSLDPPQTHVPPWPPQWPRLTPCQCQAVFDRHSSNLTAGPKVEWTTTKTRWIAWSASSPTTSTWRRWPYLAYLRSCARPTRKTSTVSTKSRSSPPKSAMSITQAKDRRINLAASSSSAIDLINLNSYSCFWKASR